VQAGVPAQVTRRGNLADKAWSGSPAQSYALPKAVGPTNPAGSNPTARSQKMTTTPLMGAVVICSWSGIRTRDLTIMSRL
jgi:hypothetical protein